MANNTEQQPLTFHDIREGAQYRMAKSDGLGGKYYLAGDLVTIMWKQPGSPFSCLNVRTGVPFHTSGASSFERV